MTAVLLLQSVPGDPQGGWRPCGGSKVPPGRFLVHHKGQTIGRGTR